MVVIKAAVALAAIAIVDGARKNARRARKHGFKNGNCGIPGEALANGPNASIVNGNDAKECAWTWQVGLKSSASGRPWCGGMLISPEWVLTAAHCLEGESQTGVYVVAGEWNVQQKSGREQTRRSAQVINHHAYTAYNTNNDIGLIKLESPMEMNGCVGTVCLPTSDVAPGSSCWITGWGTLSSGGSSPSTLQEAQVNVLSNSDCKKTGYSDSQITDSMLCAQGRTSDGRITDACQGDSGGPLVCESSGTWAVYGATSWGRGCAGDNYPGIWARVHHFVDFIDEVTSGTYVRPTTPPGACGDKATGPDSDGDCKCNSGLTCYESGSSGCTYSYTARYGWTSTRYYLPTCEGCVCE